MRVLLLGKGKTGSLVAEIAGQRRHRVEVLTQGENAGARALTAERLESFDVVIDFTTPQAVVPNIEACLRAKKSMVVGTTGWYESLSRVRDAVQQAGTGFVFGANFSLGVNIFLDAAHTAAEAVRYDYSAQIFERHHQHKKDAPSGTAMVVRNVVREASGAAPEIVSFREGDVVGMHELVFDSPNDRIYLCHDAKSRRGFAEGAVRAAEWVVLRKGFFDFRDIWREL
jgi:4-hydroxy-tetrahydrodipicolinate reductase